jgi:hypothetical protein
MCSKHGYFFGYGINVIISKREREREKEGRELERVKEFD